MHAQGKHALGRVFKSLGSIPRTGLLILGLLAALALGSTLALAQPGVNQRESFDIGIGQKLTIRTANGKDIKSVVISRGDVIDVAPVAPNQPTVVEITGKALGSTRLTLVTEAPEDERNTVMINVIPDITHLQMVVNKQFPLARVQLSLSGTGSIMVSGYMDVAEDVSALVSFLEGYRFNVVNNIKVGGVQQVQLEVCVAQVDRTELRRMGFNLLQNQNGEVFASTIGGIAPPPIRIGPNIPPTSPAPPVFATAGEPIGILQPGAGNLFFGNATRNGAFFGFLQALRNELLVKDLANPNLVTLSGRPATFLVGGDAPYGTAGSAGISGGGGSGILYRPFGARLTFVPVVLGDGRIRLEIEAEVSSIANANVADPNGAGGVNIVAPQFNVSRLHTTVEMGPGETFALGGLLQNQVQANTNKVPVLGDLPFFGTAFRSVSFQEREIEVLVVVTPRLVDPMDCSQRMTKLPGQETRTPTDFELFLEGIMEAPRGPRDLAPDGCYRPAHWWSGPFCDPPGRGCSAAGHGNGCSGGGCSSCGGGSFGLPGGSTSCGSNAVQMAPVGAPLSSRPAMPPMAVPTDAPTITTSASAPSESVTRAVMLTPEPLPTPTRDTVAVPGRTAQPVKDWKLIPTGVPATIDP